MEGNAVYHVFNRRTDCQLLFPTRWSYEDFIDLMAHGQAAYGVRICTYALMSTHWHQAIWVREDGGESETAYLRRLCASHALRFRRRSGTRGHGHVYQDRYKAKKAWNAAQYLALMRYIEANPVKAGLVARAEDWPWSGLAERLTGNPPIIEDGPVPLPSNWIQIVNACPKTERDVTGTEVETSVTGTEVETIGGL
jgi:putative transposase